MRSLTCFFALASLMCVNGKICLAQQPTGPATLESLLNSDEGQKPATAEAAAGPKRPAGTVTRPKDGVQHPDIDKAWANYDVAIAKVTDSIKAAIGKQFDAATAKGDLDTAEKWQATLHKFEKAGEIPAAPETKAAASAAATECRKAKDKLSDAYEAVVRALTIDTQIDDARIVRDEWRRISDALDKPLAPVAKDSITAREAKALYERVLAMTEQEWSRLPGQVFTVSANPKTPCETGIVLQRSDRRLFLPCPSDRWNSSPKRMPDTDFRGHDNKDRTNNGMPFMRLCYKVDGSPLRYALESWGVTGLQGTLTFVPSDFAGGGDASNNKGSVRVKVIPIE